MAERTVTSTIVKARWAPRNRGLCVAYGSFNFATAHETVSATLVIQLVALPDQARIHDMWVKTDFGGTGGYVVGDASLSNRFMSASLSAAPQANRMVNTTFASLSVALEYKVSLTASDQNQIYPINVTINGSPTASASGIISMAVYYTIDNP